MKLYSSKKFHDRIQPSSRASTVFVNVENIEPIEQIPSQLAANSFAYRTRVKQAFNSLLDNDGQCYNFFWCYLSYMVVFILCLIRNIKLCIDVWKNYNCKKSFLVALVSWKLIIIWIIYGNDCYNFHESESNFNKDIK